MNRRSAFAQVRLLLAAPLLMATVCGAGAEGARARGAEAAAAHLRADLPHWDVAVAGSVDGNGAAASFNAPYGIAVGSAGDVYVADMRNSTIRKITPAGAVSTMAGTAESTGSTDDTGAGARFNWPHAVALDGSGNVLVADTSNSTIRRISSAGVVSTLAGTAEAFGSADGAGAEARFNSPKGVATDRAGNVYVADSGNNTVRKISPTGVVSTLAGAAGIFGSTDGFGAVAQFHGPTGIAVDRAGNVYVADSDDSIVRKITPAGMVSTLAGTPGAIGSSDGAGMTARFNEPTGIATDSAGNVFIADSGNDTIRKITPAGAVSTLAGTAGVSGSADGTGPAARFDGPSAVATDSAGDVYVADTNNNTIRKISPAGVVSTIAGAGGPADEAKRSVPLLEHQQIVLLLHPEALQETVTQQYDRRVRGHDRRCNVEDFNLADPDGVQLGPVGERHPIGRGDRIPRSRAVIEPDRIRLSGTHHHVRRAGINHEPHRYTVDLAGAKEVATATGI